MTNPDPFIPNRIYTREEIRAFFGGGSTQSYLISHEGAIVAGCFRKDLNPDAPRRVYPGYGKIIQSSARQAQAQKAPIFAFIKEGNRAYRYCGRYHVTEFDESPEAIALAESRCPARTVPVSGVLELVPVS